MKVKAHFMRLSHALQPTVQVRNVHQQSRLASIAGFCLQPAPGGQPGLVAGMLA